MGLFTLLARYFYSPRKKQTLAERLAAAPLSPRRLERRRVLDAGAASAVLAPLGDTSEFVQVDTALDSPPPESSNGEAENTPPDNLQILPLDDLFENEIAELKFSFDDPDFEDTHQAKIDWGDGTTPEIINLGPGERFVLTTHQYRDDNPTNTPMDLNQVQVTVTDSEGNEVSGDASIKVINVEPEITMLEVTSPIDENDVAELQLAFTDPGSLDTHTVEIDWGDGTPTEVINLNGGERFLLTSHQYLDDDPTATPSDIYEVTVTVTDDDTGAGMEMTTLTVNNVAPEITTLNVTSPIDENDVAELQLAFTDPGSLDTHTVEIDWGDGTPTEVINLNGGERFVLTSHQYLDDDPTATPSDMYQVTVTVTDDDTGVGMEMTTVTVINVAPMVTLDPVAMINENESAMLSGSISDVGTLDTFKLVIDWGDPSSPDNMQMFDLGTVVLTEAGDGINWDPVTREFSLSHQFLDDNPTATSSDTYTISVEVTDDDTGMGDTDQTVLVKNVAPTVTIDGAPMMSLEGDQIDLTSTVVDPGTLDTFTYEWEVIFNGNMVASGSDPTFSFTPADNGLYEVTLTVTDDDLGIGDNTVVIDVKNVDVDPELNPIGDQETPEGELFEMAQMTFSDPGFSSEPGGSEETFTYDIDWGDGTPVETGKMPSSVVNGSPGVPTTGTIDDSHIYADDGEYTVTVTVHDDDGGSDSESFKVTVNNVDPVLIGTESIVILEGQEITLADLGVQIQDQGFDNPANPNEQPGGSMETFVGMKVVWGDGTEDVLMVDNAGRTLGGPNMPTVADFVHTPHTYADNGPDSSDGKYTVELTVRDDDGGFVTRSFEIQVDNVAPSLTLNDSELIVDEGEELDLSDMSLFGLLGTFSDPGFDNPGNVAYPGGSSAETFTYSIDWGDGTPVETMLIPVTTVFGSPGVLTEGTLDGTHTYADNDADSFFTITVTLTDDDGGTVEKMIPVRVNNVNPTLEPLIATDVNTKGETTLTLTFDDPGIEAAFLEAGEVPFEVLVDWGDNLSEPDLEKRFEVAEVHAGPTPMTFIILHKYDGPPDPMNPAADITIRVKIQDDDFGNPLIVDIGESNLEIVVISNPGIGGEPFRIDTTPQVPRLEFRRVIRGEMLSGVTTTADASQQDDNLRAVSTDAKATTESILVLRVIDSYGNESEGVRLKAEVLNDLPKLFSTLPDNHYAIYLVRLETNTERLVIEVYVRNGKVIDPSDDSEGTRDRPPTDEAAREQSQEIQDKPGTTPDASAEADEVGLVPDADVEPGDKTAIELATGPVDEGAMFGPGGMLPVAAGLVATRSYGTWARRVNRAMAQAGPKKWRELRRRSRKNRKKP